MRDENTRIEKYRVYPKGFPLSKVGKNHGVFQVGHLNVISSGNTDEVWEHVSVSCHNRTPTWEEMQKIKELFWEDKETVIQFHPKKSDYVNIHPYCLHLWRQVGVDHELPPTEYV